MGTREQEKEVRLEGVVHASRYTPDSPGKQFLGAAIECGNGNVWVIDYEEQSPFHAFAGRHVVVFGEPENFEEEELGLRPLSQRLIGWRGSNKLGHFRVSTMRLLEVTRDAEFVEVGAEQRLCGRFDRARKEAGDSALSFVTEEGYHFLVANDPAGATVGTLVDVLAYPVQPSPSIPTPPGQYLWIITPCSMVDIWEWRKRQS